MPSQHVLTQEEWVAAMAKRAMDRIRSELYLDLRYMNAALGALVPTPAAGLHNLATDGAALCYDPEWFIGCTAATGAICPARCCTAFCTACSATPGCAEAGTQPVGAGLRYCRGADD